MNYLTPKSRQEVLDLLITGLKRLEYRGYDSAGVAIDSLESGGMMLIRSTGKVQALADAIHEKCKAFHMDEMIDTHCGISHTRWATHGVPCEKNSHPQRSDKENGFVVVHNGIITNYKDVKTFLEQKGYVFESETDTEVIAKLIHHLYLQHPNYSFRELVEQVIQQLVSATICSCLNYIFHECIFRKELLHWLLSQSSSLENVLLHDVVLHFWLELRPRHDWQRITFLYSTEKVGMIL